MTMGTDFFFFSFLMWSPSVTYKGLFAWWSHLWIVTEGISSPFLLQWIRIKSNENQRAWLANGSVLAILPFEVFLWLLSIYPAATFKCLLSSIKAGRLESVKKHCYSQRLLKVLYNLDETFFCRTDSVCYYAKREYIVFYFLCDTGGWSWDFTHGRQVIWHGFIELLKLALNPRYSPS